MTLLQKLSLIVILFNGQLLIAQAPASRPLALDPAVKTGKLPNGLRYFIRRNTEPKGRAQLYLVNKVGSVLESDDQQGLAHFMEHMSFNGTVHFPKNELVNYLQKAGVRFGADLNAYTSFDETVYQLPIPTDDTAVFRTGMQILRDWAQSATLDPEEINKERGVVLEEKRLGKGADERMQQKYLPVLFNNSRYSHRLPIGQEPILKNFTPETIRRFYHDWYRPDLQAVIVVGDINVMEVEKMICSLFSELRAPANARPRTEYKIPLKGGNQFISVTDPEFPYTVAEILVKHPGFVIHNTADYRKGIIQGLFNQLLAQRFEELAQQPDPAFIQAQANRGNFLAGLETYSLSIVAKPGELEKGFKSAWKESERIRLFGFTAAELARAKNDYLNYFESAKKEKGKTNSENFVREYQQYFLTGQAAPGIDVENQLVKQQINGITLAEVNAYCRQSISKINRDILILAPEKEAGNLPDSATVSAWMIAVEKEKVVKYSETVSGKPLVAAQPIPGKIASAEVNASLHTTTIVLENGLKVVLKPTDFKNDEILFQAFSPGGSSLYSDKDYQSAANSAGLVNNSGVGDFNSVELPKVLSGKLVNVTPFISERSEGIRGSTTPKDLETALQLVYLYFTAPRMDTVVINGLLARSIASLANRNNDPSSVFSDTISAVLGNHSIRRTGPSPAKLREIDPLKALEIYKQRFADASDFTFVFTGNFTVEGIEPLLLKWLGSLPSLKRNEQPVDLGIHIPEGKIERIVNKGKEDKATVRLVYSGNYDYNIANNIQLDALVEVMEIKLIERLREEQGGVYSPSIRASRSKYPANRYSITINFGCAPANVDKLIGVTEAEIEKVRQDGALQTDIDKFVAEETRTTEVQLRENDFWLNYLIDALQNNENPQTILDYISSLKQVTRESTKAAANHYLSGENRVKFVLLPEDANKEPAKAF